MKKSGYKFPFAKMHGTGNDFVVVEKSNLPRNANLSKLAITVCDRKFGIGADGLIVIASSKEATFKMIFFNPDGSQSDMCGNGLLCFGKYIYEHGLTLSDSMLVEIGDKLVPIILYPDDNGKISMVTVSMGRPDFNRKNIPVTGDDETALAETIKLGDGSEFEFYAVSMGNPHAVIMVEDVGNFPVATIGPQIERHEIFPDRINVEFVEYISPDMVKARIWERGAGETLSCGSGVCAVSAVLRRIGLVKNSVKVQVPGGELDVEFDTNDLVFLKGPAVEVFTGTFSI